MTEPIEISVERTNGPCYVRYKRGTVAGTLVVWHDGWVAADLDNDGIVLGIELLDLEAETVAQARTFAESRRLRFPSF